jgi:predicted O-linked N-acetylglucosamine transferase (SPINDLY family)
MIELSGQRRLVRVGERLYKIAALMAQHSIQQTFDLALRHHQAGRMAEAERNCRQVLAQQPNHADALNLLGVLAAQANRLDAAVELIRRAIQLKPDGALAHNNLANVLTGMCQLDEAVASYRRAIQLEPGYALAHHNLANALTRMGRLDEAIASSRQAIQFKPDYAEAHYNLGIALEGNAQLDEAVASYRRAIQLKPDYAEAHNNLSIALRKMGQLDQAVASCRQAVRFKPDLVEAHNNLGIALKAEGQLDEAIASFRQAIRYKPDLAEAHNNLGATLRDTEQLDEAVASCRQAIRIRPDYAEAHNNLAIALAEMGQLDQAIASYRQAIRLKPDYPAAHSNLVAALLYHPGYDAAMIFEEHRRWNQRHAEPLRKFIRPHANDRDPGRRLRIGYVSADFRLHSVSWFLLPLFRQHDHAAFEIFCYCDVSRCDAMTDRLRACADVWKNVVGCGDDRLADMVRQDKIDILVDLSGHTGGNRLPVFGRGPAPVQVSYLGYPATTGLSEMNYRLTDFLADPPGTTESLHAEKLWRLPVCNWCYGQPDDAPPVGPLPAEAGGPIRFGTFNNFAKASPAIMDLWAAILIATPSSRLIVKSRGLAEPSLQRQTIQFFASRGVQAQRLDFRGHQRDFISHLEAYNQMDIALDTFPYHGTTTTCEALWMGVPVVTLAGSAHVSRVGVSLLSSVGLPELIAQKPDQYVRIATDLARDLPRLAQLRGALRERMRASGLMDAPGFARDIEAAYRQMWRNWCAAEPGG